MEPQSCSSSSSRSLRKEESEHKKSWSSEQSSQKYLQEVIQQSVQQQQQHALQKPTRQEPQGEEDFGNTPHTPTIPDITQFNVGAALSNSQAAQSRSHTHTLNYSAGAADNIRTGKPGSYFTTESSVSDLSSHMSYNISNVTNSELPSAPYSSINTPSNIHKGGGIRNPLNSTNAQFTVTKNSSTATMMNNTSKSDASSNADGSAANLSGISSLLPEHFSQLSQTSQHLILQQILAAHTSSMEMRNNNNSGSKFVNRSDPGGGGGGGVNYYGAAGYSVTSSTGVHYSRDSGIGADMSAGATQARLGIGERVAGVGASNEFTSGSRVGISSSTILEVGSSASAMGNVVSLPNHSSSLNMPDSPGPNNKNESNASICSSNNTLVIHGSCSPDSPWANKWTSLGNNQHNRTPSVQKGGDHTSYSSAGLYTMTNTDGASVVQRPSYADQTFSSEYLRPGNTTILNDLSTRANPGSYLTSSASQLNPSTISLNQNTSSITSISTRERVLNCISGNSTDLTDIPVSLLDQSEVLKHLLLGTKDSKLSSSEDCSNTNKSLNASNHSHQGTTLMKSSMSMGAADRDNLRTSIDAGNVTSIDAGSASIAASKLNSKSSSSGSVYSSHLDNITPTSGYSSASASTQFSLNRTNVDDNSSNRFGLGVVSSANVPTNYPHLSSKSGRAYEIPELPPPPAYPHWRFERDKAADNGADKLIKDIIVGSQPLPDRNVALTRENLRDAYLGRSNARDAVSMGRDTARGRVMVSRDTRRDLSLGPELGRTPINRDRQYPAKVNNKEDQSVDEDGSSDKNLLSRSQPDLSRLNNNTAYNNTKENITSPKQLLLSQRLESSQLANAVDSLHAENTTLRLEIEVYTCKVNKLKKFETEIYNVNSAYEDLVQRCSRREQLEKLARTKLQSQLQGLTKSNLELKEELDALHRTSGDAATEGGNSRIGGAASSGGISDVEDSLHRELNKRDVIIAQLVAQNKEMLAAKERLEMEVTAQKQTLNEQRTHIEVLDSALVNAQNNMAKLEEQVRVKQGNVAELQQAAADRRQQQAEQDMHRQLQTEMMLLRYRQQQQQGGWEQQQQQQSFQQQQLQQKQQQQLLRDRQQQQHQQYTNKRQSTNSNQQQEQQQTRSVGASNTTDMLSPPRRDEELESLRNDSRTNVRHRTSNIGGFDHSDGSSNARNSNIGATSHNDSSNIGEFNHNDSKNISGYSNNDISTNNTRRNSDSGEFLRNDDRTIGEFPRNTSRNIGEFPHNDGRNIGGFSHKDSSTDTRSSSIGEFPHNDGRNMGGFSHKDSSTDTRSSSIGEFPHNDGRNIAEFSPNDRRNLCGYSHKDGNTNTRSDSNLHEFPSSSSPSHQHETLHIQEPTEQQHQGSNKFWQSSACAAKHLSEPSQLHRHLTAGASSRTTGERASPLLYSAETCGAAATLSAASASASAGTASTLSRSTSDTSSEDVLERPDGGNNNNNVGSGNNVNNNSANNNNAEDGSTEAVSPLNFSSPCTAQLGVAPTVALSLPTFSRSTTIGDAGAIVSRVAVDPPTGGYSSYVRLSHQSTHQYPYDVNKHDIYAQYSTRPRAYSKKQNRYSCDSDYMNYRPNSGDYDDYNYSLNSERTNYSKYLARQFNKLRDATLSSYSKRLSYPLKHRNNIDFYRRDSDPRDCDRYKYTQGRQHLMNYPARPHSLELNPTTNDVRSRYHARESEYHDYVNYSPQFKYFGDKSYQLPEYENPPDYSLHRHRKLQFEKYSPQDSSLPPVIRKNSSSYIDRPEPLYENKVDCTPYADLVEKNVSSSRSSNIRENSGGVLGSTLVSAEPSLMPRRPVLRLSPPPPSSLQYEQTPPSSATTPLTFEYSTAKLVPEMKQSVPRGNPPPYHSHHDILDANPVLCRLEQPNSVEEQGIPITKNACSNNRDTSNTTLSVPEVQVPLLEPLEICKGNHPPSTTCKTCNNARSTYRKNAASLVRRASSGASLLKRKSAKLRSSFHTEVDFEETPSILTRLRREWQDRKGGSKSTGNIPNTTENKKSNPSSSSSLSSNAHSKSSESLRFEFAAFSRNLSENKWTITENQTMDCKPYEGDKHLFRSTNLPGSTISKYKLEQPETTIANFNVPISQNYLLPAGDSSGVIVNKFTTKSSQEQTRLFSIPSEDQSWQVEESANKSDREANASQRYYEIDISDNDSIYDTLIIKDLSDLNESNTAEDCNCSDGCASLDQVNCNGKMNLTVKNKTNGAVK